MINFFNQSQSALVQLQGRLDFQRGAQLQQQLGTIDGAFYKLWVLDLAHVELLDSSGLGALVAATKLAKRQGCQIVVYNPHPSVRLILEITQLDRVLTVFHGKKDFLSADLRYAEVIAHLESQQLAA